MFICVSGRQSSFRFYLHFSVMYMYRAVSLQRFVYQRTPDCTKDLRQYSGQACRLLSYGSLVRIPIDVHSTNISGMAYPALEPRL